MTERPCERPDTRDARSDWARTIVGAARRLVHAARGGAMIPGPGFPRFGKKAPRQGVWLRARGSFAEIHDVRLRGLARIHADPPADRQRRSMEEAQDRQRGLATALCRARY